MHFSVRVLKFPVDVVLSVLDSNVPSSTDGVADLIESFRRKGLSADNMVTRPLRRAHHRSLPLLLQQTVGANRPVSRHCLCRAPQDALPVARDRPLQRRS